jgi:acetyl-CoA synthetase
MSYYKVDNLEQYFQTLQQICKEPRKFWGKIAEENFTWYQQWIKLLILWLEGDIKWFTQKQN